MHLNHILWYLLKLFLAQYCTKRVYNTCHLIDMDPQSIQLVASGIPSVMHLPWISTEVVQTELDHIPHGI